MTELEINKLATLLSSEDIEIRKLAVKIIENEYNLDFTVYGLLDINGKYKYSLNIKDDYGTIILKPKTLLDRYIRSNSEPPYYNLKIRSHLAKNLIEVIIEYNKSKRK